MLYRSRPAVYITARRRCNLESWHKLGVSEQRFAVPGYRNVPDNVQNQINQDVELFGDFLVCGFTRAKPGEIQMVCIEEGKHPKPRKRER